MAQVGKKHLERRKEIVKKGRKRKRVMKNSRSKSEKEERKT